VKPQNFLLNPKTSVVKICDFGSAKLLGKRNISYICSRYYRAPELILESSSYTHTIDVWSMGCVISELFLGVPLFRGESGTKQMIKIMKVLGKPTLGDIFAMNHECVKFPYPPVERTGWNEVFKGVSYNGCTVPLSGLDLIKRHLVFQPKRRIDPLIALGHEFFDSLRHSKAKLSRSRKLPSLFDFSDEEKSLIKKRPYLFKVLLECKSDEQ